MSSLAYGYGKDDAGKEVQFVGEHRPMRDIGEAIAAASSEEELPTTQLEDYQIIG
jgi:hypothetical protein